MILLQRHNLYEESYEKSLRLSLIKLSAKLEKQSNMWTQSRGIHLSKNIAAVNYIVYQTSLDLYCRADYNKVVSS